MSKEKCIDHFFFIQNCKRIGHLQLSYYLYKKEIADQLKKMMILFMDLKIRKDNFLYIFILYLPVITIIFIYCRIL